MKFEIVFQRDIGIATGSVNNLYYFFSFVAS